MLQRFVKKTFWKLHNDIQKMLIAENILSYWVKQLPKMEMYQHCGHWFIQNNVLSGKDIKIKSSSDIQKALRMQQGFTVLKIFISPV